MRNSINYIKERIISYLGSISGFTSILGSWQVCHNVCLAIIAFLAILGITLTGMPLLFLTKIAIPIWITAFILLLITLWFYYKRKCISKNLIMINTGFITAGIPFQQLQNFLIFFWIVGGILVFIGFLFFIKDKIRSKHAH